MFEYYQTVHHVLDTFIDAKNFFIARYDESEKSIHFVYFVDTRDQSLTLENLDLFTQKDLKYTLTAYVLKTKKMQHLNEKMIRSMIHQNKIKQIGSIANDWLGIPMLFHDEILGVMGIQSYQDNFLFEKKEMDLLAFVSRQVSMLVKSKHAEEQLLFINHHLETEIENRTQSLKASNIALSQEIYDRRHSENVQKALFEITELVNTSTSQKDFFIHVHSIISTLMYATNFYIALLSDDKQRLHFPYFVDEYDENPNEIVFKDLPSGGLTEKIIHQGRPSIFNRSSNLKEGDQLGTICYSFLGVPLKERTRTFGMLAVQSYEKNITYDSSQEILLTTISNQIAISILRKRDTDSLQFAHKNLEHRVKERTFELETTIKRRKVIEHKLAYDSLHDALTGLPNRLFLSKQVASLLKQKQDLSKKFNKHHNMHHDFALLFLDLDRFKLINDSLGHRVGDLFLKVVSNKLTACLRKGDIAVRLGGDEFCILMHTIRSSKAPIHLATRILKSLKEPVIVEKHSLITSASIGIRLANTQHAHVDDVLVDADAAMYQAKQKGKNCFCLFDSKIKELLSSRMMMENDLREAIVNKKLYLVYQPVINLINNHVMGFEALLRWNHPKKGFIPADYFIPIAEETGLIVELGEFVAERASQTLLDFSGNEISQNLFININVSTIQILSRTFIVFIKKLLRYKKINPHLLNVEITESILIEDYNTAITFVNDIKSLGFKIYLDDFGTGFSSLSYLHQFPFDVIKLDKSFVTMMDQSKKNLAIVESIALMANNLDMQIVAEGVEKKEQVVMLKQFDYQFAQGYYFSTPLPLDQIVPYLSHQRLKLKHFV
jgi:diguanylate cyclase (GGDEF)-like protein